MKIRRLPSGNYNTLVYSHTETVNGKEKRIYESFTDPDRGRVAQMAGEFIRSRERIKQGNLTLGQAMDAYIKNRENVLSPSTIQGYKKIRNQNLQGLMNIPIKKLTQTAIQKEIDVFSKDHSPKTVKNAHGLLSSVLNEYRPEFRLKTSLKPVKKLYKDLPTPEIVLSIVKGTDIELPVLLAMWLSLTMSELRGIRKSDVKRGVLTLNRAVVDIGGEAITKDSLKEDERVRRLRIPQPIMELIDSVETEQIVTKSGQAIYKKWRRLQIRHGIEPLITFHDLRHINASVMHLLGVPDKYAMERGGWKTDTTMKQVYQNTFSVERAKYDELIDNYFTDLYAR